MSLAEQTRVPYAYDGEKYRRGYSKARDGRNAIAALSLTTENEGLAMSLGKALAQNILSLIETADKIRVDDITKGRLLDALGHVVIGTLQSAQSIYTRPVDPVEIDRLGRTGTGGSYNDHKTDKTGLADIPKFFEV
jgi:hypothetical protein